MSADLVQRPELDQLLARVLQRGTLLGSTVIALGLALPMAGWSGASSTMICTRIVTAGIALLIVLPVLRVFLMLIVFVCERDFRFSAIACLCWRSSFWGLCWAWLIHRAGMPSRLRDGGSRRPE